MEHIGTRLADIRKQKALSQDELAGQANINIRTLQRIEKGETEPRRTSSTMEGRKTVISTI